ncbi:MAG: hypothetical protein MRZ99_05105, partial [Clostridiales bacterium]|nr:hypothetical protein [Clostridiales bacterium]
NSHKKAEPFCVRGIRSEPRIFVHCAHKNALSPRKVFFAAYTPPQKTDCGFFTAPEPRTL